MLDTMHPTNTLEGGWANVEQFIGEARLVAFDGCHRTYLAMDDTQAAWFATLYPRIVKGAPDVMLEALYDWFAESCGLKFINAVYTTQHPNDGFVTLIAQFAADGDQDEDEEE